MENDNKKTHKNVGFIKGIIDRRTKKVIETLFKNEESTAIQRINIKKMVKNDFKQKIMTYGLSVAAVMVAFGIGSTSGKKLTEGTYQRKEAIQTLKDEQEKTGDNYDKIISSLSKEEKIDENNYNENFENQASDYLDDSVKQRLLDMINKTAEKYNKEYKGIVLRHDGLNNDSETSMYSMVLTDSNGKITDIELKNNSALARYIKNVYSNLTINYIDAFSSNAEKVINSPNKENLENYARNIMENESILNQGEYEFEEENELKPEIEQVIEEKLKNDER